MTGCKLLAVATCAALAACNTADGTRGACAEGGVLTGCPEAARTPEGACWRLVECGAILLKSDNNNRLDWDNCVAALDRFTSDRQRLVIDCVAASTCDALRVAGSPADPQTDQMTCLLLGDQ
jgi:hypothetical protein